MRTETERAYAKINLFLDIVGRRTDGFHDIRTVMQTVSLFDLVTVTVSESTQRMVILSTNDPTIPSDGRNLVCRAANAYLDCAGISAHVSIVLEKRIPVAAGLAGGSSDAAATLRAMNRLFHRSLTLQKLIEIAATLGSDVPFCLLGGTALCEGRGERITPVRTAGERFYVIACTDEHVSTPAAYGALDRLYSGFDGSVPFGRPSLCSALVRDLETAGVPTSLYNIFEETVLPTSPGARQIKETLLAMGAQFAQMSGSGPSVFGVFASSDLAEAAAAQLCRTGTLAFAVNDVNPHF